MGWRKHVQNYSIGWVEEGLHDRAITRDLDWGVSIPVEDLGPGKRIYVWFEALSATCRRRRSGRGCAANPRRGGVVGRRDAETYYFIGKDNIFYPHDLLAGGVMAYGGLNLPTDVPANQFVTFKGEKASKSEAVGDSVLTYLERYQPDAIRYGLAANLPENSDTDLTEAEMIRRNNDELVATWGNLVNRVLAMTHRNFDGCVPEPGALDHRDERSSTGAATLAEVGDADRQGAPEGRARLGDGIRAGSQRVPERHGAVEDGEDRPGAYRHVPLYGALCYKRAEDRALPVPAVLEPEDPRVSGTRWDASGPAG